MHSTLNFCARVLLTLARRHTALSVFPRNSAQIQYLRQMAPANISASCVPSPSACDFRSDTVTTPTPSMLRAMVSSSVGDDVYQEDTTTSSFEQQIAMLLGHEAGLFVSSGTMGNQLALRSLLMRPPHSVLCDYRAHIAVAEAGGASSLSQAMLQLVVPKNGIYATLEDIKDSITLSDDIHTSPTKVISLENPLGGSILPLMEIQKISSFARQHGVKLHLDGARLWNAVAAGAGTLEEYGRCFDTVSVCFSKGLGAPIGSILVGNEELIRYARWVRKSIGGGMRQVGLIVAAARAAYEDVFPTGLLESHDRHLHGGLEYGQYFLSTPPCSSLTWGRPAFWTPGW
ncbi:pyridoxal phosphate-dependent transferase [Cantharellus anzutake]|uniref:pyridoxal phosphate-dependent transferase n=1 Tax=Cantharellus anzutake TaxID=1750568 RepID=UPI0019050166|nr:pyridoxal phosphate-dependent transferase [Cantharellus anzutake]KAF8337629.1 pyridoxal phosphate-dependent transferase [Cantharellus anzutake]